jgi:hypothetical protein
MNNVLLVSEELLKTYTAISDNVQSSELRFSILQSQNIQIQESLGTNLYEHILSLVAANTISDPANVNYKNLLDTYIQPALLSYSYYTALDNFLVKFMSVGLVQNRSEQGNPIDFKLYLHLKESAKQQAEFNDNLLRRHLIFRASLYAPYFFGNLNNGELAPDTSTPFDSPITMPSAGFYWNSRNRTGRVGCGDSWFCESSGFPQWYSPGATNSPGIN